MHLHVILRRTLRQAFTSCAGDLRSGVMWACGCTKGRKLEERLENLGRKGVKTTWYSLVMGSFGTAHIDKHCNQLFLGFSR